MKSMAILGIIAGLVFANSTHQYSTTAVVTLVGSTILSNSTEINKKYKREDCPVCEGKGWYMSGDGLQKISCQYCE